MNAATDETRPQPVIEVRPYRPVDLHDVHHELVSIRILLVIMMLAMVAGIGVAVGFGIKLSHDVSKVTNSTSQVTSGICDPTAAYC